MKRRLLLDSEVVAYLESLRVGERASVWKRLHEIASAPDRFVDYREQDARGRYLAVHVFHKHAILYWDDLSDGHLKVLEITKADDFPS